jgi:hypothetical protein
MEFKELLIDVLNKIIESEVGMNQQALVYQVKQSTADAH